ncbi:MAG: hypothetical protein HY822_14760 [Acidobacteria bacterium]|nr:hypothetical protein [Acidobacteriota bacterium]
MSGAEIPVNFVFAPAWWHRHYGIGFRREFYLDPRRRIRDDVRMRQALYERFGFGAPDPRPRGIIGSRHIAGGFVVPALLGVPIRFSDDQAAFPAPLNLDRGAALELRAPDLASTWPMSELIPQMDALEREFGALAGDLNPGGLLNTCLELRGQNFFTDLVEDPELTDHLLSVVAETQKRVCQLVRSRTGTCAVSTNRSVLSSDPALTLTSNCSAHMISPALYERRILPFERRLAESLRPFGIHHCGNNLHKYAPVYAGLGARFFDVGWGSDVAQCSRELPGAFLNLRLNPVRMLECDEQAVYRDALDLLRACGRRTNAGLCSINLDAGTPDASIHAALAAARDFAAERA